MKKVFVVHGWSDLPNGSWFMWLKKSVEEKDFEVVLLNMPHPDTPTIETWVNHLKQEVRTVDEDTIMVGHSVGCQTILRFVQNLPEGSHVGQLVLVAPWLILSNIEKDEEGLAAPWLNTPIDFDKVKRVCKNITAVFSSNDHFVPMKENIAAFSKALDCKIIEVGEMGHISGFDKPPVTSLPLLLDIIV